MSICITTLRNGKHKESVFTFISHTMCVIN